MPYTGRRSRHGYTILFLGILLAGLSAVVAVSRTSFRSKSNGVPRPSMGRIGVYPDFSDCRRPWMAGTRILIHGDGLVVSQVGYRLDPKSRPPAIEIWGQDLPRLESTLREVRKDNPGGLELIVEDGQTFDTVVRVIDTALSVEPEWMPRIWMPEYPVEHAVCCGG